MALALRYLDAPRRDPTATEALRHLAATLRTQPRLPTLQRTSRRDPLTATVAECLAARGRGVPPPCTDGADRRGGGVGRKLEQPC